MQSRLDRLISRLGWHHLVDLALPKLFVFKHLDGVFVENELVYESLDDLAAWHTCLHFLLALSAYATILLILAAISAHDVATRVLQYWLLEQTTAFIAGQLVFCGFHDLLEFA